MIVCLKLILNLYSNYKFFLLLLQIELENLNSATDEINKLEIELEASAIVI